MEDNSQIRASSTIRRYLFFKSQWISSVVTLLLMATGIAVMQILVDSKEMLGTLTAMFCIISVLVVSGQLLTALFSLSKVVSPIESLVTIVHNWVEGTRENNPETLSIQKIQETIQSLNQLSIKCRDQWPKEVAELQISFSHTLKMMQGVMEQASGDTILMGLGNVCSQVAHDIRGPVSAISALATAIPKLKTEEEQAMATQVIAQSANKLAKMADELLDYRRATQIDIKPMDLSQLIKTVLGEVGAQAQQQGVVVEHDIQVPDSVRGDADKLTRVVQNLVQNSVQALRGRDGARVEVKARQVEDQIMVSVTDNGPGLPEAYMGQMFKKGFTTKGKNGTGLGLIYCETVVRGHGGQISAKNLPEGGAQFQISLPYSMMQ